MYVSSQCTIIYYISTAASKRMVVGNCMDRSIAYAADIIMTAAM